MFYKILTLNILLIFLFSGCIAQNKSKGDPIVNIPDSSSSNTAVFASGCFWCTEAVFQRLKGVSKVVSGYTGGTKENPTYEDVCTGSTGHAEASMITFDPKVISFRELLEVFWQTHDPTSLNRQGADVGTQYRSAIFFINDDQKIEAEHYRDELDKAKIWDKKIVTQIVPFTKFYPAEEYHQNYYNNNPNKGYCNFVITPKIEKFEKIFKNKLK